LTVFGREGKHSFVSNPIPLLDIAKQHAPIREALSRAMDAVVDAQAYIMGPDVAAFEGEMARFTGAKHAIACANGSDGLVLALQAIGVGPGDEVITTAFSFFATGGAIARLGAKAIFADIDPSTFNLDVQKIEPKITKRTKAIMPVHLFGQMTPMKPVMMLAQKYGLKIVEDAAQAVGAKEDGAFAGTIGDAGVLSFFPSKNLGCMGDGGMVLTNDDAVAEIVRSLRVHGASKVRYHHDRVGMNSRLDTLQAAILRVKLPHVEAWSQGRRDVAAKYRARLQDVRGVVLPHANPRMVHIYNQFTIRIAKRDALQAAFQSEKIGCAVYYPVPLHLQKCFQDLGGKPGDLPESERACQEVLSIPVFGELIDEQIDRIADVIRRHAR
jgi:dTDP-4-amino-4,6-dideoxygalactose transaminase